jgi:hypothetical protein
VQGTSAGMSAMSYSRYLSFQGENNVLGLR